MVNLNNKNDVEHFLKKIDLENIRRQYRSGINNDRIAFMNRLSKAELNWIIENRMTAQDKKVHATVIESFSRLSFSIGTPDHSDRPIYYEEEEDYEL